MMLSTLLSMGLRWWAEVFLAAVFAAIIVLVVLAIHKWWRSRWMRIILGSGAMLALLGLVVGAVVWRSEMAKERSPTTVPGQMTLGHNGPLGGQRLFPDDHPWNLEITMAPTDPLSDRIIAAIGRDVPLHPDFGTGAFGIQLAGIPYVVVEGEKTPTYRLPFEYPEESDDVWYPIPPNPPIEAGGDRHLLILDRSGGRLLELFGVNPDFGSWRAGSGAAWDLSTTVSRPRGWTSADAAGLQILPGLARADEVYDLGEIRHALRFTLRRTKREFRYPARHFASRDTSSDFPAMGTRLRLGRHVNADTFPNGAAVIVRAMQRYGLILADNGGPMFITGTADRRWRREDTEALRGIRARDFEVLVELPPPPSDSVAYREWQEAGRLP